MLSQSKISTRLAIGFGAVVALLIALAAVSIYSVVAFDRQVESLARVKTPLAIAAGRWESGVLDSARHMRSVFAVRDAESMKQELAAIPPVMKMREEVAAQVRALVDTAQQREALRRIDAVGAASIASEKEFLALAAAGRMDDAHREMLDRARPAEMAYINAIRGFVDLVEHETRSAVESSANAYRRSLSLIVLVAALAVGLAAVISTMISRGIRLQLGGEPGEAVAIASRIAQGDLTVEVHVARKDRESLMYALQQMVVSLRALAAVVADGAHAVADSAEQIVRGNMELSQRTEEQASTLEETASQMEEFTSTVAQNADSARQASLLAAGAAESAVRGGEVVNQVVSTMGGISDASGRIADIIGVIDGIAFQTNILALNAAVEAARAGEQGRGFAVVAAEVRSLAQRSAAAAKEIKGLIGASVDQVQAGSRLVTDAGRSMQEIVGSVRRVSELISEIAAAGTEQSAGIEQVNTAVMQMDQVVQQNASLVEEAAAATESMKAQAAALLQAVARFQLGEASPADGPAFRAPRGSEHTQNGIRPIAYQPRVVPLTGATEPLAQHTSGLSGEWKQF